MPTIITRGAAVVAAIATFSVAGCSQLAGKNETTAAQGQQTAAQAPVKEGQQANQAQKPNAQQAKRQQAQVEFMDIQNLPAPLATLTSSGFTDGVEKITWEVFPLRRKDKVAFATFRVKFEGPGVNDKTVDELIRPVRMKLYDTKNMLNYEQIMEFNAADRHKIKDGDTVLMTRAFGAPEADKAQLMIHQNVGWVMDIEVPKP